MARYLVTGAAGFIASRVVGKLLALGHEVVGIDSLAEVYDPRLKTWRLAQLERQDRFEFYKVDIRDRVALAGLWKDGEFAGVLNLAARAGVRPSVRDPWAYAETNMIGTLNLLDLCRERGVQKFVQASTSSLYGVHNSRPFREDADVSRPLSPYAASKGAAELLGHTYHYLYGLNVTILRYFTVFGPAGRPDMSIFRFIQWISEGRPVVIFGDGQQERDFTYLDDAAEGTLAALDVPGYEIINLGSDRPVKLMEVVHRIEALLGKEAMIEHREADPADVRATWADIRKAGELLGWEPRTSLEQGLEACVAWYLAERDWASQVDTTE